MTYAKRKIFHMGEYRIEILDELPVPKDGSKLAACYECNEGSIFFLFKDRQDNDIFRYSLCRDCTNKRNLVDEDNCKKWLALMKMKGRI